MRGRSRSRASRTRGGAAIALPPVATILARAAVPRQFNCPPSPPFLTPRAQSVRVIRDLRRLPHGGEALFLPAKREAVMSVSHVRSLYASMADRIAHARRRFGRPLTLTEKILSAHCWDF